jgi:hypothetical protein
MPASDIRSESRRQFLKFLSGSPLLAYTGLGTLAADGPTAPPRLSDPILWAPLRTEDLIKSPAEAINGAGHSGADDAGAEPQPRLLPQNAQAARVPVDRRLIPVA